MKRDGPVVCENWHDRSCWTTQFAPPNRQFDRWCEFVIRAHLHWSIRRVKCDHFPAFIREGRISDVRMTNLTSALGGIIGTRGPHELTRDAEALYNLLYILDGSICLIIDDREIPLSAGSLALWDSTRPMKFITGANLHQLTLTVSHDRLHRDLPNAGNFVGKTIIAKEGINHLFAEHLLTLDEHFGDLPQQAAPQILDATIDLLTATLGTGVPLEERGFSKPVLQRIQAYIDRNLFDPELSIAKVASESGITPRHLHRLFETTNVSVGQWILRRRLERCKIDLASPAQKHSSITDIAFRRGFTDASTFSKVFKREFGISPREFRATSLPPIDITHNE